MHVLRSITVAIGVTLAVPASAAFEGEAPVADSTLAQIRGGALTQRALVVVASEQAVAQGQLVGETMRGMLDNWFADNTVQLIANATIDRP